MNSLTERLCHSLSALPEKDVSARGARLIHHIWLRFPKGVQDDFSNMGASAPSGLTATGFLTRKLPVETAAFNNAFRFAMGQCENEPSQKGVNVERACLSIPVFSATALAEAQGSTCRSLSYAVGLGIEAYSRFVASFASSTTRKGFDPHVLAATFAAIVACGTIQNLPPDKIAQALGLGSSALTAVTAGYLPVQAGMAARDGIVMVLLIACGFRGPPDPLACRWGVYETFADARDMRSLDVGSQSIKANDDLQCLFGRSTADDERLCNSDGSTTVREFLADFSGYGNARSERVKS